MGRRKAAERLVMHGSKLVVLVAPYRKTSAKLLYLLLTVGGKGVFAEMQFIHPEDSL